MARLKAVTQIELDELINRAQDVQADAADVAHRLETNFGTDVQSPMQRSVSALAVSRVFANLAATLLTRAALQEQKREIADLHRQIADKTPQ